MKRLLFCALITVWVLHVVSPVGLSEQVKFEAGKEQGIPFMTGGVGKGERAEMKRLSKAYNLKIVLAAKSGAYLANVPVMIFDQSGKQLLKLYSNGPWVYLLLPEGQYTVKDNHEGQDMEKTVHVAEGLEEVFLQWSS